MDIFKVNIICKEGFGNSVTTYNRDEITFYRKKKIYIYMLKYFKPNK